MTIAGKRHKNWVGSVDVTPSVPVTTGMSGTWVVRFVVGLAGIDEGGAFRLSYRNPSDWAPPQFNDPTAPNYVSLHSDSSAVLTPTFGRSGIRPWSNEMTVRVSYEALAEGDEVFLVLGDTDHGSPGMRAQTFAEAGFHFIFSADPVATGIFESVGPINLPVVPGPPAALIANVPTDVVVAESTKVHLRAIDQWGNVCPDYRGTVTFSGDAPRGLPQSYTFRPEDGGVRSFEDVHFDHAGLLTVSVTDHDHDFLTNSNPIRCHEHCPPYRIFWGDLHGQSGETVGTGSIPEYFSYARYSAAIDVTAHQANDFQIPNADYQLLCDTVEEFNEPGSFVALHGYEWSGNTPAGGDRNVFFRKPRPILRSSNVLIDHEDKSDDFYPLDQLYKKLDGSSDALLAPHIGGRRASLDYHDPDLEPAIEIASQWGRFEWFAIEALERGLKVGFMGGSDDHSGRPGWSASTLAHNGVRGGLTAFLAESLSRDAIWEAFRSRRFYGTTGPRILLDVNVNGRPMGELVRSEKCAQTISVRCVGTAPIESVEVRRGTETIHTHRAVPEPKPDEPWIVRLAWRGAMAKGRKRPLDWSGDVTVANGQIRKVSNYAIDNPLDGVSSWGPKRVEWCSVTCGDWDGIILELDGDSSTELSFQTPTMQFRCTLEDVASNPVEFRGEHLEQRVEIRRMSSQPGETEVNIEWVDDAPLEAVTNAYWVWVTQSDGELAWSSPVFVDLER